MNEQNNEQKNETRYEPFRTVICDKCGQLFIPAPMHIYKVGSKYYCKWTCYNHRNDEPKEVNSNAETVNSIQ